MRQAVVNEDAQTLALNALVWTLGDADRAGRLLATTGIDPAVLAATLQFLTAHEADLVACADALGVSPQALADTAERLEAA